MSVLILDYLINATYQINNGTAMWLVTPNKESVRRISILNNANYCYLLILPNDPLVHILSDVDTHSLEKYKDELESWCGMKFKVYDETKEVMMISRIKNQGEKILPIILEK